MAKTLTLAGSITAVDTRTVITGQGSVTAPSTVVPSGVSRITKIIVAAAAEGLADGSAVFFLRLGGNAVLKGEQAIMISGAGRIAVQAGSDAAPQICRVFQLDNTDIEVAASDTLSVSAEMAGNDLGTARVVVTLIFGK